MVRESETAAGVVPGTDLAMSPDVPLRGYYQDKLAPVFEERAALFDRAVGDAPGSLLDVGCNLGDFTAHYARRGMWSVGFDGSRTLIEEAYRRHGTLDNGSFMVWTLDPDTVWLLPTFDVVLLLSVHHHWLGAHGPQVAGQMLRDIVQRTRRVVVFESASRNERFGAYPPGFVDNDEATVTAYHERHLREFVSDQVTIEPLGKARCVGAREPYRWSWALRRHGG